MKPGDRFELRFAVTEETVVAFAQVSTDDNPVHMDTAAAVAAGFGGRIAHGMLAAAFISAVLGKHFPGPGTIYLSQKIDFRAPVLVPSSVIVRVECLSVREDKPIATMDTRVLADDGTVVVDGEAIVRIPSRG